MLMRSCVMNCSVTLIRGRRDARLGGFQGWLYCVVKDGGFTTQEFMGLNDEIEVL